MKYNLVITLAVFATLVGCGKSKSSSGNPEGVTGQGVCSQATVDSYRDLIKQSEKPITSRTKVTEISNSCRSLEQTLGGTSCQDIGRSNRHSDRDLKYISYADVSNYCAEIETYVSQRNPPPAPPRPVPVPQPNPRPSPRPPRYDGVLVENLDTRYSLYFEKSYLSPDEKDIRNSETRCQLSISDRANRDLRDSRAKLVAASIQISPNGATYDISAALIDSHDLIRLMCRSHNSRLSVQELNQLLDGVAEIRQKR